MTSIFSSQNLQTLRRRKYCFRGPPGPPVSRLGPEPGRPAFLEFPLGAGMFDSSSILAAALPPVSARVVRAAAGGRRVWLSAAWPRALLVAPSVYLRASVPHRSARREI